MEKGTATVHFGVRYYERKTLHKGSDGTISANPITGSSVFYVWVCDALPWVNQDSAEAALQEALAYLVERRNN